MAIKKSNAPTTTVTRNIMDYSEPTGNIYESVLIMGKRANQIAVEVKNDLQNKLREFGSKSDSLDEEFENREQIEISRYYEKLPKPTLEAEQEFLDNKVYFRNPTAERDWKIVLVSIIFDMLWLPVHSLIWKSMGSKVE